MGRKLNYLINAPNNQWWRFITPMFVHINMLHVMMNMFGLLILGPFVEKLYGSAKFVVFWVASGLAGSVATYLTLRPSLAHGVLSSFIFRGADGPAAGASGALFGLVGVLFVFGIKYRHELPEGFKRVFGTGLLPIIFINLFIGFVGRSFIGNAAHLGGLFTGAALALIRRLPSSGCTRRHYDYVARVAGRGVGHNRVRGLQSRTKLPASVARTRSRNTEHKQVDFSELC